MCALELLCLMEQSTIAQPPIPWFQAQFVDLAANKASHSEVCWQFLLFTFPECLFLIGEIETEYRTCGDDGVWQSHEMPSWYVLEIVSVFLIFSSIHCLLVFPFAAPNSLDPTKVHPIALVTGLGICASPRAPQGSSSLARPLAPRTSDPQPTSSTTTPQAQPASLCKRKLG